jgi:hypothetical protein
MSGTLNIRCRFSETRYEWSYEGGSVLNTTFVDDYFRLLAYSRCKDSKKRSLTLAVISTPQAREPTTLSDGSLRRDQRPQISGHVYMYR